MALFLLKHYLEVNQKRFNYNAQKFLINCTALQGHTLSIMPICVEYSGVTMLSYNILFCLTDFTALNPSLNNLMLVLYHLQK